MAAGFDSRMAFVREADIYTRTWPSATPATATSILPLLAEGVGPELGTAAVVPIDNDGQAFPGLKVAEGAGGELLLDCRYSGLEFVFAAALGIEAKRIGATVMPEVLGGGAYRHLFEIDPHLEGQAWLAGEGWISNDTGLISGLQKLRRGSYIIDKSVLIWEALSCMLLGLNIGGNGNAPVVVNSGIVGHSMTMGTTVSNDLSGLTCTSERVLYTDMTMSIAPLTDAPLDATHVLPEVTGFQVTLNNSLSAVNTQDTREHPDEPSRTAALEVRGGFAIPSYKDENDDLAFEYQIGTLLIGLIEFEGPEIAASGENFTLRIWLPLMQITGVTIEVGGPGIIQQNYEFTCYKPQENPTGFPTNVKNGTMMIELINDTSAHPLI
jgi:hypothetical protein